MKVFRKISNLMLSIIITLSTYTYSNAQQNLQVHFIDVGQGDSTYIELPDGTDILIDAGHISKGSVVADYLKKEDQNIDIEYLIATHPDVDHIGGMQEVFKQFNVKNFYYPYDVQHNTETWNKVLNLASEEGCNIYDAKSGTTLNIGGATIKFVQPDKDYSDNNEDSVIILVDYKDTEILLTGDAEAQTEKDMVNSNLVGDIDILKVGHHGSDTSTTQELLNKTKPEYAVISVGSDNNYGHPTSNVLNRLNSIGTKIWRTDLDGDIVIDTDGTNVVINGMLQGENLAHKEEWKLENGKWYFYKNGAKQLGWIMWNGVWYYTNSSCEMVTGWQYISDKWYYLQPSGAMLTGWLNDNGICYYLDDSGAMLTGWQYISDKWYYLQPSGAMLTGWLNDNSIWYYLDDSGAMLTGWQYISGKWYYLQLSGAMQTGWLNDNGIWYYLDDGGVMLTGWQYISGKWYYLQQNGAMLTGWLSYRNSWYYFYDSGEMATCTIIDNWYIDENGVATPKHENEDNCDDSFDMQKIVYITPSGKSYHNSKNCTALKRSTTILEVSYSEAINKGKSDPCNLCVK